MARTVRVETRKWPAAAHWEYDATYLGADAHGHWVAVPTGVWLSRPGRGFHAGSDHVVLLPHDAWWVATFYGDDPVLDRDRPVEVYVDIATPSTWEGDLVHCVDLDLDVIRTVEGTVFVDDEDEFAEHRLSLGYPDQVVRGARQACSEVYAAVVERSAPFDRSFADWLTRLRRR